MIKHQTNIYNWQFLFLGANIDAVSTAKGFGINAQFASNYTASSVGTDSLYTSLSRGISDYRGKGVMESNWNADIK